MTIIITVIVMTAVFNAVVWVGNRWMFGAEINERSE